MARYIRAIAATIGVALLAFAAVVGGFSVVKRQSPLQVLAGPIAPPPQQVFGKDHLLVLVVGLDYDYDDKDMETSKSSRSDVIKAVNLDFATHRAYVLSVPRDMDAILPNGQEAKINEAQSDGGIAESQSVIANWLGVPPFDRYVVLRIDTMKDLINAIGGVDVDVMNSDALKHQGPNGPLIYDDNWGHLHVHLNPGLQHLNGDQAVGYARFRHDWCSDPCRIIRQDQVIKAIVLRLKSNRLNTIAHLGQLLAVMRRDVETNLTTAEELSLANAFADLAPSHITTAQVPYVDDKVIPTYGDVIVPDVRGRAQLVQTMLLNPPQPEPSPGTRTLSAVSPAQIHVDVQNGTAVPGLANRVAAMLRNKGFVISHVGNASSFDVITTEVHQPPALTRIGAEVKAALGPAGRSASVVSDRVTAGAMPNAYDVTVVLGEDLATASIQTHPNQSPQ